MRRLIVLGLGAVLALALSVGAVAAGSKTASFTNYSLAETTGTTCPGSSAWRRPRRTIAACSPCWRI